MWDVWRKPSANRFPGGRALALGLAACLLGVAVQAAPRTSGVTLVSRAADSQISDTPGADSQATGLSADGRFLAFSSAADNLVPRDTNGSLDIFLYDRVAGTTTLVSHAAGDPTTAADANVFDNLPVLSADGRWVAYLSSAANLVPGVSRLDPCGLVLYDRITGATTFASHADGSPATPADGGCGRFALSADGRYLAYESYSTNLVSGQSGAAGQNIFLYDRVTDRTTLVSHDPASATTTTPLSESPSLSADGRFVLFRSRANGQLDLYQYDRTTGINTLVTHQAGDFAAPGNGGPVGESFGEVMSAEGGAVAFLSLATNLVPGLISGGASHQAFLWDRASGAISLVSHAAGSPTIVGAAGQVGSVALSADGSTVAFDSNQRNLVPGPPDATSQTDVFLYHAATGTTTRITADPGQSSLLTTNSVAGISDDGQRVLLRSARIDLVPGLVDGNGADDLFLYDAGAGATALVSHLPGALTTTGNAGSTGLLSADGQTVALNSFATDLVSGQRDTNGAEDVFLYAAGSAQITPVSRRAPALPSLAAGGVSGVSTSPGSSVSANGRWIAFVSDAATLVAGQDDANAATDVFLRDTQTGTTLLVSHAAGSPARAANGPSDAPSIDRDGRYVAFQSTATDLVAGQEDGPESPDVFLYDRVTGTTTLVSHTDAGANVAGGGELSTLSANGKVVAFEVADEASGTNGLFLYDRERRATLLVTRDAGAPALSADGRFIAFLSGSPELVPGDTNSSPDIFLFDRIAGTTALVTRSAASPGQTANGGSYPPAISADGRFVAFASDATDLAPGVSPDSAQQVYLYDRVSRHLELASHAAGSTTTPGDGPSDSPALDAEGRFLVFTSAASNLAGGSPGSGPNVFLYDRVRRTATLVARPLPALRDGDNFLSGPAAISADGRRIAFVSAISNLVPGQMDGNGLSDLFLYDREKGTTVLLDHLLGSQVTAPASGAEPPFELSADGRCVEFETSAPGLVSADFNARKDVFLACLGEQD